jgi:hypothetical protein
MAPPGKEYAVTKADGRKPQRCSPFIKSDRSATAALTSRLYGAPLISGLSGRRTHTADPAECVYASDRLGAEESDSGSLAPRCSIFT